MRRSSPFALLSLCLALFALLSSCSAEPSAVSLLITPMPTPTAAPTQAPTPSPSPSPSPSETPLPSFAYIPSAAPSFLPELLLQKVEILQNGKVMEGYLRETPLNFGSGPEYAGIDGVLSFRGNNFRDRAAFGSAPHGEKRLEIVWEKPIGAIRNTNSGAWTGVGWNGQPAIVRWP
ncbi:MAG: hypothetical protein LBU47_00895, partial [Christensenellaceae bacterium]|nr:hypothetical protein [Christensenellaceae bacterium]